MALSKLNHAEGALRPFQYLEEKNPMIALKWIIWCRSGFKAQIIDFLEI